MKIKESYKVFFAENGGKGITSTSANHIANKGKELLKYKQSLLDNVRFMTTKVRLISGNSDTGDVLSTGVTVEELKSYNDIINEIGKVNAMIAWLREAIKAKEQILADVRNYDMETWAKENEIDIPVVPRRGYSLTSDDVVSTWDENKRARYYALDAYTSLLGKWIHPRGGFFEAKKDMHDKLSNPHKIEGSGRDAIIYTYSLSLLESEVNDEYKRLSEELRHKEAEFNKMKSEIDTTVAKSTSDADEAYVLAHDKYMEEMTNIRAKFRAWQSKTLEEARNLKIHMPGTVQETFDSIQ